MAGTRPAFPNIGWDPTPGDVEDTRDLAKKLGGLASDLGTAVRELERIECGAWKGKTAIAFTEYIGEDVTPLIRKSFDARADAEAKADGKGSKELGEASSAVDGVIQKVHDLEERFREADRTVGKELDKAADIAPNEPGFWDKLGKGIADAWDATGD